MEKEIGKVTHWYDKISVAVIKLTSALKTGDTVKVKHGEDEFEEAVSSMQIDHKGVESAGKGDEVAVKFSREARDGSVVSKVS